MRKFTILLCMSLLIVAIVLLAASPSFAIKPNGPSAANGLMKGNSDVHHLELYEKDPGTWNPVAEGAWGKLTYDSDSFVFNGHGLESGEDYALIVYVDPWPNDTSGTVLMRGTANDEGNIHLSGGAIEGEDIKIWLVLSDDVVSGGEMTGWNPTEYLFEYDLITNP